MSRFVRRTKILFWFCRNPRFWGEAMRLIWGRLIYRDDQLQAAIAARARASEMAISVDEAIASMFPSWVVGGIKDLPANLVQQAAERTNGLKIKMGGAGSTRLIFQITMAMRPKAILETGVAQGWSSLAFLYALKLQDAEGQLVSVDMPYPGGETEAWVACVVPRELAENWYLIRHCDRTGIPVGIRMLGGILDLCHYDSDKSVLGRKFGYTRMWKALREGGILISDDISDNFAFFNFAESVGRVPIVVKEKNKFIGIVVK